ncbi:hypothetical protein [Edaphobacter aggregans]|uniref:hypothetical protein n=1 Tax=Edaphobacter aggregans TaxID=570835 RepID=UPI000F73E05D|nr:hypothetical protein [Edaphobacter aggregans]
MKRSLRRPNAVRACHPEPAIRATVHRTLLSVGHPQPHTTTLVGFVRAGASSTHLAADFSPIWDRI